MTGEELARSEAREEPPGLWLPVGRPHARFEILLRRLDRKPGAGKPKRAVVLIPGANSSCDTFLIPNGGLAGELRELGCDVWLLDWRPSPRVMKRILNDLPLGGSPEAERRTFTLDRAVAEDIPAALKFVRDKIGGLPLSVHGHCVGGGGLAMAIARGVLAPFEVDRVVLSTLGLFYEVPWNTWIKAEDYLLEGMYLPTNEPQCRAIDPKDVTDWPGNFRTAFDRYPRAWLPRGEAHHDKFLRQLSFMVGQPYSRHRLDSSIDGDPVEAVFGPLHAGLYTHLGQMVRRGYSASYNTRDQIDRTRLYRGLPTSRAPKGDLDPRHFPEHHITLVAAGDDFVWHRDSIDLMYEWLRRNPKVRCEKHIVQGYNIQELYWAKDARTKSYGIFAEGLGC